VKAVLSNFHSLQPGKGTVTVHNMKQQCTRWRRAEALSDKIHCTNLQRRLIPVDGSQVQLCSEDTRFWQHEHETRLWAADMLTERGASLKRGMGTSTHASRCCQELALLTAGYQSALRGTPMGCC
jgi:hypothetical protein